MIHSHMQYAVSDIHGCYDKYINLLRRIDLKDSDTLYVLGDMIDRGPDGLKILRRASGVFLFGHAGRELCLDSVMRGRLIYRRK